MTASKKPDCLAAFTLVELLVVIVIISVLASIAFMTNRTINESAATTVTLNNLRQLQLANMNHANERNGLYVAPKGGSDASAWDQMWFINDIFVSSFGLESEDVDWNEKYLNLAIGAQKSAKLGNNGKPGRFSIAINNGRKPHFAGSGGNLEPMAFRQAEIRRPSEAMSFCDANDFWVRYGTSWKGWVSDKNGWNQMKMAYRNKGKAAVVYFDGHAGLVSPEESIDNEALWDPSSY